MSRFKTFFASFFLLIFTFNVIIYYSVFEFYEFQAKAEMAESISAMPSLQGTTSFKLPLSRMQETTHSEIWMDGKLYDIVRAEVRADSVIVYVMNDSKEQNLVEKMKAHEEATCELIPSRASKPNTKNIHKVPAQKYYPNTAIVTFHFSEKDSSVSCVIDCFYSCLTPAISTPPPEYLVS